MEDWGRHKSADLEGPMDPQNIIHEDYDEER
jgi:hypothetical protein